MTNPVANEDQFAAEAEVRAMWDEAATRAARDHCAQLWRVGHGSDVPLEVEPHFDDAMDAWMSNYLFKAAARDPVRPRFVRNFMPGHRWNGAAVPDARMGGDNPDNCYRLAGIAHGGRYRITGKVINACPAHISFTLVENWGTSITTQTVEIPGIDVGDDGGFAITIDDQPAAGRRNHMTTNPRVKFLFVRDSMMDWERETPLILAIERIDAPAVSPMSFEQRLEEALRRAREEVPLYYWFFRLSAGHAINSMPPPLRTASVGGLVTQASSLGRLHLEDDQAVIIRFDPAGAAYNSLQLATWWYRSVDAHRLQSGLSATQAAPGGDGLITTVVSARDPGIANWVQTDGLRDLLPMIRWQGLPDRVQGGGPVHWLDIVPFDQVDAHLPDDIARLSREERLAQIDARRGAWSRRINS